MAIDMTPLMAPKGPPPMLSGIEVYIAEQLSLGRRVALKVLRSEMGSVHGMSERFRREALLLSSVDHPSVVRIIELVTSAFRFLRSRFGCCRTISD